MEEQLSESLEDYLEIILNLEKEKKVARTKDIAEKMNVNNASVSSALKILSSKNFINYEPYSFITLKEEGRKIAEEIANNHNILKNFFINVLEIEKEKADFIACRMEHFTDKVFISRLVDFIKFIEICPRTKDGWLGSLLEYYKVKDNFDTKKCKECINKLSS